MIIEAAFEQDAQIGAFLRFIVPRAHEIRARIDAEMRPFAQDRCVAPFLFDEQVLRIADRQRRFLAAADDVPQLGLSLSLAQIVRQVDDDELEILFPVTCGPVIDLIVAFDTFGAFVGQ